FVSSLKRVCLCGLLYQVAHVSLNDLWLIDVSKESLEWIEHPLCKQKVTSLQSILCLVNVQRIIRVQLSCVQEPMAEQPSAAAAPPPAPEVCCFLSFILCLLQKFEPTRQHSFSRYFWDLMQ